MASDNKTREGKGRLLKRLVDMVLGKKHLESSVDSDFLKKLEDLPFKVAAKKMLGGANNINEPDWFVCVRGRLLLLETKKPALAKKDKDKQIREGQRIRARWWQRAGAKYVACTSADDMIEAVTELYREQVTLEHKEKDDIY